MQMSTTPPRQSYHRDLLHKADLRPPPHQDSHLSREVKALFCLKPRVQNNKTWIRKYLFQKAPESISGRESPSYSWVVRYVLNLSQFINEYVFIFNIQIWPNRPGHPTDLPFRSKTLQPKCVKLIMRTGAITKPCTSKPDRNIRKSSFVITGAGVWQEKIKKWKQIYFLWIHIIFINGYIRKLDLKIWLTRYGLGGHPKDLLFRLWTLQPMCIELMMWTVKVGTCCDFWDKSACMLWFLRPQLCFLDICLKLQWFPAFWCLHNLQEHVNKKTTH